MTNDSLMTSDVAGTAPAGVDNDRPVVLSVGDLVKRFRRAGGDIVNAVDHVSLDVRAGEVLVLLGPSGCGKTTLLRCIAGLELPDSGRIELRGRDVDNVDAGVRVRTQHRGLSMIFQSYALWPHLTAFQNVAYPLRARGDRKDFERRVVDALDMVGIAQLRDQFPSQLSGGQQQRVALARALVAGDDLILFDEPLSNVDARVREQLRLELAQMQERIGFAAVYVTHDQTEALSLAHRIAVMESGRVAQLGTPREIYASPATHYVATFVGTANELLGTVIDAAQVGRVVVDTPIGTVVASTGADLKVGDEVVLTSRPEASKLRPARGEADVDDRVGTVVTSMFVGSHTEHVVAIGDTMWKVWSSDDLEFGTGAQVYVTLPANALRAHHR